MKTWPLFLSSDLMTASELAHARESRDGIALVRYPLQSLRCEDLDAGARLLLRHHGSGLAPVDSDCRHPPPGGFHHIR